MDPRLYALGGTFAILVIALIATIVSGVGASRRRRPVPTDPATARYDLPALPAAPSQVVNTRLDGLELDVPTDSPNAAFLRPLRKGEWHPADEPAPAASLPSVSLDARVASFEEATGDAAAPVPTPLPEHAPVVLPQSVPTLEELEETLAALRSDTADASAFASVSEPIIARVLEPAFAPEPIPAIAASPEPSVLPDDAFWESVFRGETDLPSVVPATVVAPTPPVALTPVRAVAVAPIPPVMPEPAFAEAPPAVPGRPRAVVRSVAAAMSSMPLATGLEPLAQIAASSTGVSGRSASEDIVMAAPVEMWFGESRIGVKAGSKTYAQFRKYSDVLFADLQAAKARNR